MPATVKQPRSDRRVYFCRFTDELYERLAAEARAAERSVNAEVVFRLKQSLGPDGNEAASS